MSEHTYCPRGRVLAFACEHIEAERKRPLSQYEHAVYALSKHILSCPTCSEDVASNTLWDMRQFVHDFRQGVW